MPRPRTTESTPSTPGGDAAPLRPGIDLTVAQLVLQRHRGMHAGLLPRQRSRAGRAGGYQSRFRGRGLEFDEVRAYQLGDDVRSIDWRVTARTGETHTKLFRDERERPVLLVVDYRHSMRFGTRQALKSYRAAEVAALLAWLAADSGDRVGGLVFTDEAFRELRPRGGRAGVLPLLKALADLHPGLPTGPPPPGRDRLAQVLQPLHRMSQPGSLIFLISDFAHWDTGADHWFRRLAGHRELVGCFIYDPFERALPAVDRLPVSDGERMARVNGRDPANQAAHRARFAAHAEALRDRFVGQRQYLLRLSTEHSVVESVQRLLSIRAGRGGTR